MKKQGFSKQERIASQKLIDELFTGGQSHSLTAFPLRAVFMRTNLSGNASAVQLLISVSKRRFKHAVDRNRVKRQLREAYRKNKALLSDAVPEGSRIALAFVWMSEMHLPSPVVEQRVVTLLKRIAGAITVNS